MNAKMPELKRAFEAAGFSDVRTLLSSGNVVFSARKAPPGSLELRAEEAMQATLGRSFGTFIRPAEHLQGLIGADPFAKFGLSPKSKRVVTFLRDAHTPALQLPIERDDARILAISGSEVLCAYVPGPKGPAFMALLERTFGATITTRTLDTVRKCAWA
jgi:uncharacterized protein (DUF1697 family)